MAKWRNISCRSTLAGSWAVVDPQDADNITDVIAGDVPAPFPTPSLDTGKNYGEIGPSSIYGNGTSTNSGANPLLAGYFSFNSASDGIVREVNPGTYDVRIACGSPTTTGNRQCFIVIQGTEQALEDGVSGVSLGVGDRSTALKLWVTGLAVTTGDCVVSPTDRTIWKANDGGTAGAVAPNGGVLNDTFVDNDITWTNTGRVADILRDVTTTAQNKVIDQNGADVLCTAWAAQAPVEVTVSGTFGNAICLFRLNNTSSVRVRQFSVRPQAFVLGDVVLLDDMGVDVTADPKLYARQPSGMTQFTIVNATGDSSATAFALEGDLAPYLSVVQDGSAVRLRSNGTPLPDSMAGVKTLDIVHTDPGADPTEHTTSFDVDVISSQGKPAVGYWSDVATQNWLHRKLVKDRIAADAWHGYNGEAFQQTWEVDDGAELNTVMEAINPNPANNYWYRILVKDGLYQTERSGAVQIDFGATGGLLIENKPGHSPLIANRWMDFQVHGIHWRGVTLAADMSKIATNPEYQFVMPDNSADGILGGGRLNAMVFEDVKVGWLWDPAASLDEFNERQAGFVFCKTARSMMMIRPHIKGGGKTMLYACRALQVIEPIIERSTDDNFGGNTVYGHTSTVLSECGYPDNHCYVDLVRPGIGHELDFEGLDSDAHADLYQKRRTFSDTSRWAANAGNTGKSALGNPPWEVGEYAINMNNELLYQVASVTTGITGAAPGPAGTGAGIVDGGVTWNYVADYGAMKGDMYLNVENLRLNASQPLSGAFHRQMFLNSDKGYNTNWFIALNNCLYASGSAYAADAGQGFLHVEHCVAVGPSALAVGQAFNKNYFEGYHVRARHNIAQAPSIGTIGIAREDEVIVSFATTITAPATVLATALFRGAPGGWSTVTTAQGARYQWPGFVDNFDQGLGKFMYDITDHMMALSGTAGLYPRMEAFAGTQQFTKAQIQDMKFQTYGEDTESGLGPVEVAWSMETGDTGMDVVSNVSVNIT